MPKEIDALILAGGMGTRMGKLTEDKQKCLLETDGEPILIHVLNNIANSFGSARVIIATGYKDGQVRKLLGTSYGSSIKIEYVHGPERLETKRRLLLAEDLLTGPFLYTSGDVITNPSHFSKLSAHFEQNISSGEVLGVISGASDHRPALTHALILTDGDRAAELIYPPHTTWASEYLRDMTVAFYHKNFLHLLRKSAYADEQYIASVVGRALREGTNFAVEKYFDRWYHFVKPEDLQTSIQFEF